MTEATQPEWMKGFVPTPPPERPPGAKGNPFWVKGVSGNPKGRPPGLTPQAMLTKRMLEEGEAVLDAVLAKAKEGDPASSSLVLSRILPTLRSQSLPVQFTFDPEAPITKQIEQVLAAVAAGAVAPDVGQQIISAIGTLSQARLTEELAAEVAALKAKDVTP